MGAESANEDEDADGKQEFAEEQMDAIELEADEVEEEEERAATFGSDRYGEEDVDRTTDDVSGADEV